jgi:hypothetical protein
MRPSADQSVAGVDDEPSPPDDPLEVFASPLEPLAAASGDDLPSPFAFDAGFEAALRSFFAQPEPLKWNVGGAKALTIVPSAPHSGQKRGP